MKWKYDPKPAASAQNVACCDVVNRGAAYADRRIFNNALYSHTVAVAAVQRNSGKPGEARRGKHGEFYDGYLVNVMMDADSELITAIAVLPANGDEAVQAQALLGSEEKAHNLDIENLSTDAIAYNGPVLHALSYDPAGPQVIVWTPPKERPPPYPELFHPSYFQLNQAGDEVTCLQGEKTRTRYANKKGCGHHYQYQFSIKHQHQAMPRLPVARAMPDDGQSAGARPENPTSGS